MNVALLHQIFDHAPLKTTSSPTGDFQKHSTHFILLLVVSRTADKRLFDLMKINAKGVVIKYQGREGHYSSIVHNQAPIRANVNNLQWTAPT